MAYMHYLLLIIVFLLSSVVSFSQGSCGSEDGTMLETLIVVPDYDYLETNGFCMNGTGSTQTHTMCFDFINQYSSINVNMGYSASCINVQFTSMELFDNTCTSVGTGLAYTSLNIGETYSLCFTDIRAWGGPICNGFDRVCPYWGDMTVLPITLIGYNCDKKTLFWKTAQETNNSHFNIYKSKDNINFELAHTTAGNGTSQHVIEYSYTDYLCSGPTYYKIEQVDYDGRSEEFETLLCECKVIERELIGLQNLLGQKVRDPGKLAVGIYSDGLRYKAFLR